MEYSVASEKAARFLSSSLKTEYEVRNKLKKLDCENEVIDDVISHFKEISYINDKEYVNAYIRQSIKMPKYSIFEIENKLKIKGISSQLLQNVREKLENTDYEKNIIQKYIEKHKNDDPIKLKAYLYRRGFTNIDM